MFKFTALLLCLGAVTASDVDTYNQLVDETLYMATQFMVEYKLDTLPLPAMSVTYKDQKLASWDKVTGTLTTGPGTAINATGIHRNGDANITLVGEDKMVINVGISTDNMVLTFLKFNMDFSDPFSFSNDGGMQLKIGPNDVSVQITFQKAKGVCKLTIDQAEITSLGSIDFLIQPDTWWADIKDEGIDLYMKAHNNDLKIVTNMYLQAAIQKAIDDVNPCQYLPF